MDKYNFSFLLTVYTDRNWKIILMDQNIKSERIYVLNRKYSLLTIYYLNIYITV
jgi:hypothetical protein